MPETITAADIAGWRAQLEKASAILQDQRLPLASRQRAIDLVITAGLQLCDMCDAMHKRLTELDTTAADRQMVP